jgi:hypothetical protein
MHEVTLETRDQAGRVCGGNLKALKRALGLP